MSTYTQLLLTEMQNRRAHIPNHKIKSIYFGGGTPSLLPAQDILTLRRELANLGFEVDNKCEITIEINPGTITNEKLDLYLDAGVNRYSVGVQTFRDDFLINLGREHTAETSRATLRFLKENKLSYSFDLLFGLPAQNLSDLQRDLEEMVTYAPTHVSLYNMTVPSSHFLNQGRADEDEQASMFAQIEDFLFREGIFRYELSNFAKPGFESVHNQTYWSDGCYWGLGVSAHSYFPNQGSWGLRFFNPSAHNLYSAQISQKEGEPFYRSLPASQVENLTLPQSLTDYCHTHLRMKRGLSLVKVQQKYGGEVLQKIETRLETLVTKGLLHHNMDQYSLTEKGWPLANQVFLELTFLQNDM